MMRVGFVGWRGMVGSVLMQRMMDEEGFSGVEATFYSTSKAGAKVPEFGATGHDTVMDATDIESLKQQEVIVTSQGGD